jgi:hypothetical protein
MGAMPGANLPFQLGNAPVQRSDAFDLASHQQAECLGQVGVIEQRRQRAQVLDAARHHEPVLCKQAADLVDLRGAQLHQSLADSVHRQNGLLIHRFDWNELHARPRDRFTDRLRVRCTFF